jgi:PPOX class probable F420-dependent enzyme
MLPPMRDMSRDQALAFLSEGTRTGKLATVRPDGRPHVAPIWFVIDGDSLVFNTWHTSVKARNLRANPLASLVVDMQEPPFAYVIVEGTVEISEELEEIKRIATHIGGRYMGSDRAEEFGERNGVEGELAIRLSMERVIAKDDITG